MVAERCGRDGLPASLHVSARPTRLGLSVLDGGDSLGAQTGDAAGHETVDESRAAELLQLRLAYLEPPEAQYAGVRRVLTQGLSERPIP